MEYLDFQVNVPVFVKSQHNEISLKGHTYKKDEYLPWQELGVEYATVRQWWLFGYVYHNQELEKQTKVGDRLSEFDAQGLEKLVDAINVIVKEKTNSASEFKDKRCKKSRLEDKQRGLLRSFLRNNRWIEEQFFEIRDRMLDE